MTTNNASVDHNPPTLDQLRRHAHRFGCECVIETARAYLPARQLAQLEAEINGPNGPRQRRTTGTLREQVTALAGRGMVSAAIADALNISDRRVAEILGKSRTARNGGQKRRG